VLVDLQGMMDRGLAAFAVCIARRDKGPTSLGANGVSSIHSPPARQVEQSPRSAIAPPGYYREKVWGPEHRLTLERRACSQVAGGGAA